MKYSGHIVLLSALSLISCGDSDTPDQPVTRIKHIASITSPTSTSRFTYDNDGRITRWTYDESEHSESRSYSADYEYSGRDFISVRAVETDDWGIGTVDRWDFHEDMSLDSHSMAEYADGIASMQRNSIEVIKKKYHCDFSYNADRQLTLIEVSEWIIDSDGMMEKVPMTYDIKFEWAGSLLVKVTENDIESEYTYHYGDTGQTCMPLLGYAVFRSYYMPLRYTGVFGIQSDCLIKKIRTTYFDGSVAELDFPSYSFSTTTGPTYVTGYKTLLNGVHETEYEVTWE